MKKYVLISNPEKDAGSRIAKSAAALLQQYGAETILFLSDEKIPSDADAVLTFGGDGTLLHAAWHASLWEIPILGINVGTLGYLTELEAGELPLLAKLASGEYRIENRMMLSIDVLRDGKNVFHEEALNDAVISHGEIMRVIPLTLCCDGIEVKSFRGDGIIVSSPTGSTAYSLSAGGPVVDPLADSITITPLSAHALYAKSFVFSPERRIQIVIGDLEGRSAFVAGDGRNVFPLSSRDLVTITRSLRKTRLIKIKDESFLKILYQKL
ncbi:MAG: NAD(+)/NADH kinase [Clostridia bacterium]|nr:NAD(+)/NADH kinase [Clostridia bacterium]